MGDPREMCPLTKEQCYGVRCMWWKSWVGFKGRENEQEMGACAISVIPDALEDMVRT